jgi:hypothetical protein
MLAGLKFLVPLGIAIFLVFLLSVRKPWGRTARRIVGTCCLVCFIAVVIINAIVAYIVLLSLPQYLE